MAILEAAFRAFALNPGDVVEGALLVSRLVHPGTDPHWCRTQLDLLAEEVTDVPSAEAVLGCLRANGFRGAEHYYDPANSALELVLRRRRGIPISLAALIIGVATPLELEPTGINFPGHFLVSLGGQLVDPFTLEPIPDAALASRIAASGVPAGQALRPASATDMVLRMLNNLRTIASGQGVHLEALRLCDFQLLLAADAVPVLLARAETRFALGQREEAIRDLERALTLAPSPALASEIANRLDKLAGPRRTLH